MLTSLILFGAMFAFIIIGVPVAFCILIAGSLFIKIMNYNTLILVTQRLVRGMDSFPFLAIPLFLYAGYIMEGGGMSKRLVDSVKSWFGNFRGSIGIVTIVSCAIFAALTGSGPATVVAIGSIMMPALLESGYTKSRASGLIASGGALGPIIPPSIPMIVYGTTLGVSIPSLFMGAVIPGIILSIIFIIINQIYISRWGIRPIGTKSTMKEKLIATWRALGSLLLPVIVLGGIYGGIFTPTEASAVAVIYTIVVGLIYRDLNFKKLLEITERTVIIASTVMFVLAAGNLFTFLMASTGIPKAVSTALLPILNNQTVYLLVLAGILFVAGALLDATVSILLIGPVLVPVGISLGIDPVHLGVVFCINLCIGFITPPYGSNLFTASTVLGESFTNVTKGAIPFMIVAMLYVVLLSFFPALTTFLPNLM